MKALQVLILAFLVTPAFPQTNVAARNELQNLLLERKEKFGDYTYSLEKRSGIFGGQTKSDIKRSNEVLREIIITDNRIISALNRVADFKTFEKVNKDYDLMKCNRELENLRQIMETVSQKSNALTASNASLQKKTLRLKWLITGLLLLLVWMYIRLRRKTIP